MTIKTTKTSLVTVIAAYELEDRIVRDLEAAGIKAYTVGRVDGRGVHGKRTAGLVDAPNFRLEVLVPSAVARKVLERVAKAYEDQPIIAYVQEVEAIAREHSG
jgi:nitrogen regulatory protein PII